MSFINAGLHLAEREERSGIRRFLEHAELLRKNEFPIMVSVVATPAVIERYTDAISLLNGVGLFPVPRLLRGAFDGRVYPESYSETDRTRFRAIPRKRVGPTRASWPEGRKHSRSTCSTTTNFSSASQVSPAALAKPDAASFG